MKRISYIYLAMIGLFAAFACTPDKVDIGPAPEASDVQFSMVPKADQPNVVEMFNDTPESIATWDFGNNITAKGDHVVAEYPLAGTYTVTMTIYTQGGSVSSSQELVIAEDDFTLIDRPDYNFLTGGPDALEGKTWVWDNTVKGHMGIGQPDLFEPNWWAAEPMQKAGLGVYDDEITFFLSGFKFDLLNNGDTYAKDYMADELTAQGGTITQSDDDITLDITFDTKDWNWSIVERDGDSYLVFGAGAFPSWHTGGNQEYLIQTLNEDELVLRTIGGDTNAWYYRFIRKGFERPIEEEPVIEKPLEANDFMDDFEGNGNINWYVDEVEEFVTYDNPVPVGANTSAKVAKYQRAAGEANMWTNVQMQMEYRFDLSSRNVIKMKVMLPEYNDYETVDAPDWAPFQKLTPIVALKLQDSTHPEPWTTQVEVAHTLTVDQMGQWVELEFDFSGAADRTDFDKIVLQIGGEGHYIPGVFFVDDIELLP